MTQKTPTLDSFRELTTEELVVLGLLWKHYSESEPSPHWGEAREVILERLTPEDGADIRSAHAARVEAEGWTVPVECYAAVQWSALAERERDNMPKKAYDAVMRAWSTLFSDYDAEIVSQIAESVKVDEDGFFDFDEKVTSQQLHDPDYEPGWDGLREKARLTASLAPLLAR